MSGVTISQLALVVDTPVKRLLDQLKQAGIDKKSESDIITDAEKLTLLKYLKETHFKPEKRFITTSAGGKPIKVEVRKKKTYVKSPTTPEAIPELSPPPTTIETDPIEKQIKWSKIKSIKVKNFKAIEEISLDLADVTILVGPNGSGKSSVLQALHWAARAASYIEPKKQSEVIAFDRLDYSPSSEPLRTAHKSELSSDRGSEPTSIVFNHASNSSDTSASATIKIWAARNRSGISVNIEGGPAVTPFKQRTELITAYIPGLAGLSERETILVKPLLRRQAASGDAGSVLRNILFNIASRQPSETDFEPALQRLSQLNKLVQMVHPGVWVEVFFDEREDFHIQATFKDSKLNVEGRPLESAATGILQVIQIFAYLILFRPKLILIDEPDAHLHPDKQERLIEALEFAVSEFGVQSILTTHSPHIARAASHNAKIAWVKDGRIIDQDDETVKSLLGWGGLDKKILFFVEDEDSIAIKAILRQWPNLYRQIAICRCFGVENLPRNKMLKGLIGDNNFGIGILLHRDGDFMTPDDAEKWSARYQTPGVYTWVTDHVDVEAFFCQPDYLQALYGIEKTDAEELISIAAKVCTNTRKTFFEKRKVIIRTLYENGGGASSEELWKSLEGTPSAVLGKTLHAALKTAVKEMGHDDKLLNKFHIPSSIEVAKSLRLKIESMLEETTQR
ncbi:translation initiation factor IF-2 N-terminal domain-containing protein [Stutzerimonas nitrititolerans]|uniref:translation initiation factor IF-2 N-terminal domain-containing protein n=1 Tax=Stutzerimonas nitrititolerans TaxID=2482751 RepID=UPI0028998AFD|nr:translation initiation factor IF-2 N-terminal domain-containing protein [Stutzerimonas nitrititolerans]